MQRWGPEERLHLGMGQERSVGSQVAAQPRPGADQSNRTNLYIQHVPQHQDAGWLYPKLRIHDKVDRMFDDPEHLRDAESAYREAIRHNPGKASMHNGLGNILYALGRPGEAVAAYREAIRIDQSYADAYNGLGDALRKSGQAGQAEAAYRKAIGIDPGNALAYRGLGLTLCDRSRFDEAEEVYRNAIHLKPDDANSHRGLGDALVGLERFGEAEIEYRDAIRLNPGDANSRQGLGNALRALGRSREAIEAYRRAIDLNPWGTHLHVALGRILWDAGRPGEAVDAYREAIRLDPEICDTHRDIGISLLDRGECLAAEDRFVEAIQMYHDAYLMGGDEYRDELGEITGGSDLEVAFESLSDLACNLESMGHLEEAEVAVRVMIDLADLPGSHISLGGILGKTGRFDEAIDAYRKAIDGGLDYQEVEDLLDALLALGDGLREMARPESAAAAYRMAMEISESAGVRARLGHALLEMDSPDEAIGEYLQAIELDPAHVTAHNGLGIAMLDMGRFSEAADAFRAAIRLAPSVAVVHFNLGAALCGEGEQRFEEAEGALMEAIRLNPESADAHSYLADALRALGRLPEAAESYQQAIRLDPDHTRALDGLDAVLPRGGAQQSAPPSAGQFADDLRAVASWYASAGLTEVPLLSAVVPEGLPDDLAKVRARLLEISARDVLPASRAEMGIASLLEAELQKLEGRDRAIEILSRRTFAGEPETLDAIGKSWGVTRERVRQIESKARAQLVATLIANTPLGLAAGAARRLIGTVLPLSDLLRLLPALADEIGSVGQPVWRVLSALDEDYEIEDGWCATPAVQDAKSATGTWLQEHADKHGVADMSHFTLLHASQHVALPEEATRGWLAYCGYDVFEDWIFTTTSTISERAAAMLSVIGSPLSSQEILDHEPESRSLTSLRNALGMDERFERVDRDSWALIEWCLEPYNGIKDQIHQELARSGGEISMGLLIERIAGKYSVAEGSVRAYAGAPPFESSNGLVRFAAGKRASSKTLTSTRRLYQREDSWLYRVKITGEHLRGSGSPAPVALATQVGLQRGSSCRLNSPLGPQLFSWASLQPAFGTIQRFLIERNVVAGQEVFLEVSPGLSFDVRPVDADRTRPLARALSLAGCGTVDAAQSWPALARAIGLPEDSPAHSVIAGYRDRGDTDVADLLQAIRP